MKKRSALTVLTRLAYAVSLVLWILKETKILRFDVLVLQIMWIAIACIEAFRLFRSLKDTPDKAETINRHSFSNTFSSLIMIGIVGLTYALYFFVQSFKTIF